MAPVLTRMFNLNLSLGNVPREWKLANVVPLLKSGDRESISNYRPISLCSVPCKIVERVVASHLLKHSNMYGIIPLFQHAFMANHSCSTQTSTLYNDLAKCLENTKVSRVDTVFLDWAQAFDKVKW